MSTASSKSLRARRWAYRIGTIGIDQGISSLTNFIATVAAARFLGPKGLGIVAVCMVSAYTVIGLNRATTGEPILVYGTDLSIQGVISLAAIIGLAGGTVMFSLGWLLDTDLRIAMWVSALALPGLIVGDTARYVFFSQGRPARALICDATWAVVQVVTALVLLLLPWVTPTWVLSSWALGGLTGAGLSLLRLKPRFSLNSALACWKTAKHLSGWAFAQVATGQIGSQIVILSVAGVAGFASVGAFRLAQTLLSPLAMILTVVMLVALPEIREGWNRAPAKRVRETVRATTVGAGIASVMFAVAITLGKHSLLSGVFGASFGRFESIVLPVALGAVAQGMSVGPGIGIRALGEGPALFVAQVSATTVGVPLIVILAGTRGPEGAAWGLLGQLLVLCLVSWAAYARVQRQSEERTCTA